MGEYSMRSLFTPRFFRNAHGRVDKMCQGYYLGGQEVQYGGASGVQETSLPGSP